MPLSFLRLLLPRAAAALLLMVVGAAAFATTAPDSWPGLTALVAHLGGLLLLYSTVSLWMNRFGGRARLAATSRGVGQGCAIAFTRVALILLLIIAAGASLWSAGVDLNEIRLLLSAPRYASAQVTGRELIAKAGVQGYIHYAYRVSPTLAPEDRFAAPRSDYRRFPVGTHFDVTFARDAPRVHRIGRMDWQFGVRRLCYWVLLVANLGAYLFLPLWLLEFRRQPPLSAGSTLANADRRPT